MLGKPLGFLFWLCAGQSQRGCCCLPNVSPFLKLVTARKTAPTRRPLACGPGAPFGQAGDCRSPELISQPVPTQSHAVGQAAQVVGKANGGMLRHGRQGSRRGCLRSAR
jgi:hypothetical protein